MALGLVVLLLLYHEATADAGQSGPTTIKKCKDYSPFGSDGSECHIFQITNGPGSPTNSTQTLTVTFQNGSGPFVSTLTPGQTTTVETHITQVTLHETNTSSSISSTTWVDHP